MRPLVCTSCPTCCRRAVPSSFRSVNCVCRWRRPCSTSNSFRDKAPFGGRGDDLPRPDGNCRRERGRIDPASWLSATKLPGLVVAAALSLTGARATAADLGWELAVGVAMARKTSCVVVPCRRGPETGVSEERPLLADCCRRSLRCLCIRRSPRSLTRTMACGCGDSRVGFRHCIALGRDFRRAPPGGSRTREEGRLFGVQLRAVLPRKRFGDRLLSAGAGDGRLLFERPRCRCAIHSPSSSSSRYLSSSPVGAPVVSTDRCDAPSGESPRKPSNREENRFVSKEKRGLGAGFTGAGGRGRGGPSSLSCGSSSSPYHTSTDGFPSMSALNSNLIKGSDATPDQAVSLSTGRRRASAWALAHCLSTIPHILNKMHDLTLKQTHRPQIPWLTAFLTKARSSTDSTSPGCRLAYAATGLWMR